MISLDIIERLVPDHPPEEDYPRSYLIRETASDGPERFIAQWSAYLRYKIQEALAKDEFLDRLISTSGSVGTGIFRVPRRYDRYHDDLGERFPGFPVVSGFQFGLVLLRGTWSDETEGTYVHGVDLEFGRYKAPITQTIANFIPHGSGLPDGYVAAGFVDSDQEECGITAAHVVDSYRIGRRVPVRCPDCDDEAKLRKLPPSPGLIDAAIVEFPCGGPGYSTMSNTTQVRSAKEGETVAAHYGDTGKKVCTVMMSLSSSVEIKSAALPKHFLIDVYGHPGDSGSLIAEDVGQSSDPDAIGIYLGETDCRDEDDNDVTYGYALDLEQAATILGAKDLKGEYNV